MIVKISDLSTRSPLNNGQARHPGLTATAAILFLILYAPNLLASTLPELQSLVAQLGSDDPRIRENAVGELMDLKKKDLPTLRAAALSQSPLLPGQIAALRESVIQIFLAGENFKVDPEDAGGFMGIQLAEPERVQRSEGVLVVERLPGFPAYRYLRPGDVIVKFTDRPDIKLHAPDDFIDAMRFADPGTTVRLSVLRGDRTLTITVPLDFRPLEFLNPHTPPTIVEAWLQPRQERAEAYWSEEFSALDPANASHASQASTFAEP